MRFYLQAPDNIMSLIQRCYFEAEHSRLKLAMDRLAELDSQFPGDARIVYAEGLIRRDYLGQGLHARELFERAYELAALAKLRDDHVMAAACNAATLSRNEQQFRKWAQIAASAPSTGPAVRDALNSALRALDDGLSYRDLPIREAEEDLNSRDLGSSAAHMEVALAIGGMERANETQYRRQRAQRLRSLDAQNQYLRESIGEWYAPDERLELHEAFAELDRALVIDPYDAELWNLSAAWQILLGNLGQALEAANRAIELRDPYPNAHINAAAALFRMHQFDEAKARIDLAARQARQIGDQPDVEKTQKLADAYSRPPKQFRLEDLVPMLEVVLRAARRSSDEEMLKLNEGIPRVDLVNRLLDHAKLVKGRPGIGFVPMIAELLSDFTPETVCGVLINAKQRAPRLMHAWVCAAVYLIANCDGVERRDASRLFALLLFIPLDAKRIRENYRTLILAPSAAGTNRMSSLNTVMREELGRIHPDLVRLVTDQPPISPEERARGNRDVLDMLVGPVPPPNPNLSSEVTRRSSWWGKLFV